MSPWTVLGWVAVVCVGLVLAAIAVAMVVAVLRFAVTGKSVGSKTTTREVDKDDAPQ